MSVANLDFDGISGSFLPVACEGEMRIPDSALKCVVYIGAATEKGTFRAIGTGFIVYLVREDGIAVHYLVTADHVRKELPDDRGFAIRINDEAGRSQLMRCPKWPQWWRHPTDKSVDAAVYPWSLSELPFSAFPTDRFVTGEYLKNTESKLGIGIGDEVFVVGLFRARPGQTRITPILRTGHIAMMATEPIQTKHYGEAYYHLVEAFTTAGLSGSPVFVHETVNFAYVPIGPDMANSKATVAMAVGKIHLLGLVHGIQPLKTMVEFPSDDPDPTQKWHPGISLVVPSTQILEILDQPKLIEYEQKMDKALKENTPIEASLPHDAQGDKPKRKTRDVKVPPVSRKNFFDDLTKATRKREK